MMKKRRGKKVFRNRAFVAEKGCLNSIDPTEVCVNLGEVKEWLTKKRMFYCSYNFPEDCSKCGCPKMVPINERWRKDLKKIGNYE